MKRSIGFGTYKLAKEKTIEAIHEVVKHDYDFIDTAFRYENENIVGEAIRTSSNPHIKVQTKIWPSDYDETETRFHSQLKTLGLKKVWSLLLHRPSFDFNRSIKAWKVLIKLKKEGFVEKIGVSNFDKDMIEILIKETGVMPQINQIELSVLNFRDDRVIYCHSKKIAIQAWTSLGINAEGLKTKTVLKLAKKHGYSPAQICLAFLLEQNITPLVKSKSTARVIDNIKALDVSLTNDELNELKQENIYKNMSSETYPY